MCFVHENPSARRRHRARTGGESSREITYVRGVYDLPRSEGTHRLASQPTRWRRWSARSAGLPDRAQVSELQAATRVAVWPLIFTLNVLPLIAEMRNQ